MQKRNIGFFIAFIAIAVFVLTASDSPPNQPFHTDAELDAFKHSRAPIDSGEYFLGSVRCQGCHGFDTLQIANIDANGTDINLYDDWQSSMMAFSAKDPLWRAKVSHEILVNPGHSDELQTKCTSCHAPMGHFTAMFKGHSTYTLADLVNDTLGLNGVACGGCHSIAKDSIGSIGVEYSGNVHYDTSKVEYGPYENPLIGPMELYVGLIPTYSLHMSRSAVCAACHTLITKTADLNGNYTGGYFIEQATYHEWINSSFNSDQPCQSCHMPQIQDPVIIANNILNLPPRSPFNQHKFMGGNSFMLNLIKQNKSKLGIDVLNRDFDSTITATIDLLKHSTLNMNMVLDSIADDTLFVRVALTNKAGHKFPSGYPSRRAFVQFAVTNATDTIFQSGMLRPDFEVSGQGAAVEPHYNIITDSTQAQIYEQAMGNVNSNFTTVLERAAIMLKDNRIPPLGFTTTHYAYDTTRIAGAATTDADFNKAGTAEGTGMDVVHYHIPLHGKGGDLHISSAVYYQVLPPRWLGEMFAHSSDFIDSFKTMYSTADKAPVLIASGVLDTTIIGTSITAVVKTDVWKVFPIPTASGNVVVQSGNNTAINHIAIWNSEGRKLKEITLEGNITSVNIQLPEAAGIYYLKIETAKGFTVKKVVRD